MKLHLARKGDNNLVTAYGDGYVEINRQRHEQSVVVMPTQLLSPWTQNRFDALTEEDLKALISLGQEVVLLGTGSKLRFPPPHLLRPLAGAGIGILPDYAVDGGQQLVQVLRETEMPSLESYLVYAEEMRSVARVQAFRDFLVSKAQRWNF